MLTHLL
jgi:hypothetical protein